ncbi:EpsG family protein [Pseudomonas saxonica]|uniref:EpsG family protein n=1 Tax=Pseudomonas saxonica TaxID=2600598 RepID=A0ABY3GL05_9PSED|nr:EpsG family protein [Pseudomonas saxonica]TWR92319.1 EpsG family protein [Pseudomonas saxonica]
MAYYAIAILASIFLLGAALFRNSPAERLSVSIVALLYVVGLAIFAGFRSPDIAPDYLNYVSWLKSIQENNLFFDEMKDPLFVGTYLVINDLGFSDTSFFFLIALLSLGFKYLFSKFVFDNKYVLMILFLILSRFYIPHDFIQVRVGLAIGLASCGLILFFKGRRFLGSLLYLIGLGFHLSVSIFIPVFFMLILNLQLKSRLVLSALIISSFMLSFVLPNAINIFANVERVTPYLNGGYATTATPLFSFYFMSRFFLIVLIITVYLERLSAVEKFVTLMSILGLCIQIMLSWNDAFSLRFAELFGFFDMAMFCMMYRFFDSKSKLIYSLGLMIMSFIYYYSSLKLVSEYAISTI